MKRHSTNELLERLRTELDAVEMSDREQAGRIADLMERIDFRLKNHVDEDEQQEFLEDISNEVVEFEVEHPETAATVRGLLNLLSSVGL